MKILDRNSNTFCKIIINYLEFRILKIKLKLKFNKRKFNLILTFTIIH